MCYNYADKDYLSFTFMQRNQRVQCSKNLVQLLFCHYGKLKHWVMISLKRKPNTCGLFVEKFVTEFSAPLNVSERMGRLNALDFFLFYCLSNYKNKDCSKCVMNQLVLFVVVWFLVLFIKYTFFANFRSSIKSSSPWESSKIACKNRHKYQKVSLFNLCSTSWVDVIF